MKPVKILVIDTLDFLVKEIDSKGGLFKNQRSKFLNSFYGQMKVVLRMGILILFVNNSVSNFSKKAANKTKPSMGDYLTGLVDERYEISKMHGLAMGKYGGSSGLRTLRLVFGSSSSEFKVDIEIYDGGVRAASVK